MKNPFKNFGKRLKRIFSPSKKKKATDTPQAGPPGTNIQQETGPSAPVASPSIAQSEVQDKGKGRVVTHERNKPLHQKPPKPIGDLQITKLKFETDYDVCADVVENFDDYRHFYVLEEGKYHWLLERTDERDIPKPPSLPVTINSREKLSFKAVFKVEEGKTLPVAPVITVSTVPQLNFEQIGTAGTSGEFELTFRSVSPAYYKDTIRYIEHFELNFEYSIDGGTTVLGAGASKNELYITWRKPLVERCFSKANADADTEKETMMINYNGTGGKYYIPETLLYLGCARANGLGSDPDPEVDDENLIVDTMFNVFENCHVRRRRETLAVGLDMGYWRDAASMDGEMDFRGLRYLLRYGVACCAEWASFFLHIAFVQGIFSIKEFDIHVEAMLINKYPVQTDTNGQYLSMSHLPAEQSRLDLEPGDLDDMVLIEEENSQHAVAVPTRTGIDVILYDEYKICAFLVKEWDTNDPWPPRPVESRSQGNMYPLSIFVDHAFVVYKNLDGNSIYYDPSYGVTSDNTFDDVTAMLKDFAEASFTGILAACRSKEVDRDNDLARKIRDVNHSLKYKDLFELSDYDESASAAAPGYLYETYKEDMENYLLTDSSL